VPSTRIGILGGTFNPPHIGHLICAQEARLRLGLDRVLMVPAGNPPFKLDEPDNAGQEHRLALCRAAVGKGPGIEVSDLEIGHAGPSYTVDTLERLHSLMPDSELYLIVGGDVAAGLPSWHEPERVLELATIAVAERRGTSRSDVDQALRSLPGGERAVHFEMPWIGISSTEIRRRVKEQQPISYLVPDAVANYIDKHHLYGGSTYS
jgi:nicotinate-nucleotide adenylyltransferase